LRVMGSRRRTSPGLPCEPCNVSSIWTGCDGNRTSVFWKLSDGCHGGGGDQVQRGRARAEPERLFLHRLMNVRANAIISITIVGVK
jgi:hypothetical protein